MKEIHHKMKISQVKKFHFNIASLLPIMPFLHFILPMKVIFFCLWAMKHPKWRRKWQPTPVFLPGESQGRRGLVGYSLRGFKELDTTKQVTYTHTSIQKPNTNNTNWLHIKSWTWKRFMVLWSMLSSYCRTFQTLL